MSLFKIKLDHYQPAKNLMTKTVMVTLLAALSGCASTHTGNPDDPLEPINRKVYQFNEAADTLFMKPAAIFYDRVLPEPAKEANSNFFSNLEDFVTTINDLLQFKFSQAASDGSRFVFNSTFGLFGLMDVATGLEKNKEDFGQTLGYWGLEPGPYLVLPFLGPSTLRDTAGLVVDNQIELTDSIDHPRTRNQVLAAKVVEKRAGLMEQEGMLNEAAIDRYAFIRDTYLQYRRNQVYDGNPPYEFYDDFDLEANSKQYLPGLRAVEVHASQEGNLALIKPEQPERDWVQDSFHLAWQSQHPVFQ